MKNDYEIRGDVTAIFLKRNDGFVETLIDTVDLEKADELSNLWQAKLNSMKKYYCSGSISGKDAYLHRHLMDNPKDLVIDHINSDTLDNRRSVNLRTITQAQNLQNRLISKTNTSGYHGVYRDKKSPKWIAQVCVGGKNKCLGKYENIEDAALIASMARSIYHPFSKDAAAQKQSIEELELFRSLLLVKKPIVVQCANIYSRKGIHFFTPHNSYHANCCARCGEATRYYRDKMAVNKGG